MYLGKGRFKVSNHPYICGELSSHIGNSLIIYTLCVWRALALLYTINTFEHLYPRVVSYTTFAPNIEAAAHREVCCVQTRLVFSHQGSSF